MTNPMRNEMTMTTNHRNGTQSAKSLDQALESLDRTLTLQVLAHVQHRMSRDAVLKGLLQARLAHLTSEPPPTTTDQNELLTAKETATILQVSTSYLRTLVKTQRIPVV